jgi:putative serine protease PepD
MSFRTPNVMLAAVVFIHCGSSGLAAECQMTPSAIYADVRQKVVKITTVSIDPDDPSQRITTSISSGFFVKESGVILTNFHSVMNAASIEVDRADSYLGTAKVTAGDAMIDLALLKLERDPPAPDRPLRFAKRESVRPGTAAFALGFPGGLTLSISEGIISAVDVKLPRNSLSWSFTFIQSDARVGSGSSGGPLIDACGDVLGVNTLVAPAIGFGFSIAGDEAEAAVEQLSTRGFISRPWLGITGRVLDERLTTFLSQPTPHGFLVETVEAGSDGERAGLLGGTFPIRVLEGDPIILGGDIITSVDGREIKSEKDAISIARSLKVGNHVRIEYSRSGNKLRSSIELSLRPMLPGDLRVLYRDIYSK